MIFLALLNNYLIDCVAHLTVNVVCRIFIQERCPVDLKSKEVLQEALHLRISLVSLVILLHEKK